MTTQAKYFILGIFCTLILAAMGWGIYNIRNSWQVPVTSTPIIEPTLTVQNTTQPFEKTNIQEKVQSPKITIEDAGGGISDLDKDQIVQKIINPFLDYYRDAGQGKLVSLTISLNTKPNNVTYPFLAEGVFDTGSKNSFTLERVDQNLHWWAPVCMGPCLLTDDFRTKYPEIVKLLGQ